MVVLALNMLLRCDSRSNGAAGDQPQHCGAKAQVRRGTGGVGVGVDEHGSGVLVVLILMVVV